MVELKGIKYLTSLSMLSSLRFTTLSLQEYRCGHVPGFYCFSDDVPRNTTARHTVDDATARQWVAKSPGIDVYAGDLELYA